MKWTPLECFSILISSGLYLVINVVCFPNVYLLANSYYSNVITIVTVWESHIYVLGCKHIWWSYWHMTVDVQDLVSYSNVLFKKYFYGNYECYIRGLNQYIYTFYHSLILIFNTGNYLTFNWIEINGSSNCCQWGSSWGKLFAGICNIAYYWNHTFGKWYFWHIDS